MAEYEFIICKTIGQSYVVVADSEEEARRLYDEGLYEELDREWDVDSDLVEINKREEIVE